MKKTYTIEGMTCGNCVAAVKTGLESLAQVKSAEVSLADKSAVLDMTVDVPVATLQSVTGKYKISEQDGVVAADEMVLPEKNLTTYMPLLLIVGFIILVTVLAQYPFESFDGRLWMRHFMAGFFIVFSFFKLLNLSGFAQTYSGYDIIAARWRGWGFIYPFVELGLGVAYLINFSPVITNCATIVILGVSSIGVIQSVMNERKIKCACLGEVFNLPMSTVTIIEDISMVIMAALMLMQL